METKDYERMIKKIDQSLKNGNFKFQYMDFKEENNVFTGKTTKSSWEEATAVERKEQFIIDNNGVYHSILKDQLKF